ncbi:MAG: hypothetical protein KC417_01920 [Myxococcales bacterium]|nr:hypothetical protein [Myxococcales bacterium]
MASPTSPQFGAPPTASEFGGLPRSGGATPSSPGSAPSQPAALGGSNAPKAPAPPAFGQGGGFGQPPAGGGFGAPTGGGGGSDANDAARDKKKKLLFAAIGCLALVVLGCIGSCVFFYFQVKDQATALPEDGAAMNPMLEKLARVPLAFVLGNVVSECRNDPSGESIRSFFHPSTFDDIKGNICASSDEALEVFSDPSRSQVFNLSTRPEADLAKEAGYDPNTCFLFDSASGQVITCRDEANHTLIVGYRVDATP